AVYKDLDFFKDLYKDPFSSRYIFMKDEKLLKSVELDYENNKVKIDLSKLYEEIDLPETLSNLLGKYIKKINLECVEFEDGTKMNLKDINYSLIKPLIWW
ncbi:MAG: site-specific DNA-methyltransferase, partial [Candidatus Aenigmarchaeota archaeon]|nr:site-specific DNA-methyltransferase [Candidatus Aenigmarchaeota archaeon]